MEEIMECAHCHKPTTKRCSRCKLLLLCSRECLRAVWKSHKADCKMIEFGRAAAANGGANPETLASIPLAMSMDEYAVLFAESDHVRSQHAQTETRLDRGDPTLSTGEKVRFYTELLQALDATGDKHANRSLVEKMALNNRYNTLYCDAVARLAGHELNQLNAEMQRRRIGAHFKQQG